MSIETTIPIKVVIEGLDSNQISALVKELRELGYRVGRDYNFEFSTGKFDWINVKKIPPRTAFYWTNLTGGTWFALRWVCNY